MEGTESATGDTFIGTSEKTESPLPTEQKIKKKRTRTLVNPPQVRYFLKGFKLQKGYIKTLNEKMEVILKESMLRAASNGRKTIMSRDL